MSQAITVELMIPLTVYSQPSGNYDGSSLNWQGDPVKAASYYRTSSYSTVYVNVEGFTGLITIQGLQDQNPTYDGTWTNIAEYGDITDTEVYTDYHPIVIVGNYTWLRAWVQNFTSGIIKAVTVNY
jgi:hypothetical protein